MKEQKELAIQERQEKIAEKIKKKGEKGAHATSRPRRRKTRLDGANKNRAIADELVPLIEVNGVSLQKKNVKVAAKRRGKKAVKLNERQTYETVNVVQHENRKCECVVCQHIFGDLNDPLKHQEPSVCPAQLVGNNELR